MSEWEKSRRHENLSIEGKNRPQTALDFFKSNGSKVRTADLPCAR